MKSILTLIAVLLTVAILGACGNDNRGTTDAASSAGTSSATMSASPGPSALAALAESCTKLQPAVAPLLTSSGTLYASIESLKGVQSSLPEPLQTKVGGLIGALEVGFTNSKVLAPGSLASQTLSELTQVCNEAGVKLS